MSLKKLSIIVPTYNERDNVGRLAELVDESLWQIPYELIFIDDSTDGTDDVLKELSAKSGKLRYEHRTGKTGLSSAVIRGFELAQGDYVAVMDADLQHPPAILRNMYCAMGNHADICVPSRFIAGGNDGGLNIFRKIVSASARYIGKLLLPCLWKVSDPTGGLFMLNKDILTGVKLRPIGWKILIEVLADCRYERIIEIPYKFGKRNAGQTKLSGKVTAQYLKQLLLLAPKACRNNVRVTRWTEQKMNERTEHMNDYIIKHNK